MNTPDRLSAEERELARLLGHPGVSSGPSARIDAAVVALARAELDGAHAGPVAAPVRQKPPHRRRRGPITTLAVAASMVLAVGIAWQLRPLPPATPTPVPASVAEPAAPAPASTMESAVILPPASRPAPPAPVANAETSASPASPAPIADAPGREQQAVRAPEAAREPVPMPAARMAADASAAAANEAAPTADHAKRSAAPSPQRIRQPPTDAIEPPAPSAPAPAAEAMTMEVEKASLARDIESDAALTRQQWLKRIRERRDSGDLQGARASLQRFALDYPEARIPRDLRALLEE
ncbi:MAG: hypothetical protein ACOH1V_00095 [Stenotrophomonas sp.]